MYESNHLFWICSSLDMVRRVLGGCGCDGSFVVKAVQIAAGIVEVFDPFFRLVETFWISY